MAEKEVLSGRRVEGPAGLPLVFLHAFPFDRRMWAPQIEALRGTRSLLAPDLMGFGASQLPEGPVGLERQADAVARYLETEGVDRAAVCGLSMGGYIALALAERHPRRVGALVLADTRATADTEEVRLNRSSTAERVLREGVAGFAEEMIPKLLGASTRRHRPEVVETVRGLMLSQPSRSVASALLAMRDRPDRTAVLKACDRSVLVLVGEEDGMTTPEEAESMVAMCREGRLALLPGAGHLSNLEAPEAFSGSLRDFLSGR